MQMGILVCKERVGEKGVLWELDMPKRCDLQLYFEFCGG